MRHWFTKLKATIIVILLITCSSCMHRETVTIKADPNNVLENSRDSKANFKASQPEKIDISSLSSYFDDVFAGEAAKALSEDRLEDAMRLFDDIARQVEDPVLTPRARFVAAYLAHRLGDNSRALTDLPGLAHQLPELADVAWESAALSALRLKKYSRAVEFSNKVSPESVFGPSALLISSDSLRRAGQYITAAEQYRHFLKTYPNTKRQNEARSRLTECLVKIFEDGGKVDRKSAQEALDLLSLLQAQSPRSKWTRASEEYEKILILGVGKKIGPNRKENRVAQKIYEKALSLKNKMKNSEALKEYNRAIKKARLNGSLRCLARFEKAVILVRLRKHGEAAALFDEVATECTTPNIRIKALYKGAKAFMSSDRPNDAIRLFGVIEKEFSEHSYADDARLHTARCHLMRGAEKTFMELLTTLPDHYPSGDMRSEALWLAAKYVLKKGDVSAARKILDRYFELFPCEDGWYIAGRSGYWAGRAAELDGDLLRATALYEQTISSAPLSFYMLMAHSRLKALDPQRVAALMNKLSPPGGEVSARFSPQLLKDVPGLAVGVELLRVGLITKAKGQLNFVLGRSDTPAEIHWIVASLLRAVGEFSAATIVTTGASDLWKKRYPSGVDLMRWTLAFPTAFEEEVELAAKESGVDKALLWAVMREESGFNTRVESWANAIGLMQLIFPTARSMAARLNIKIKRRDLKIPAINIRLGAAYLSYLQNKFDGHTALMIAGYNAGEGAVGKWVKANPKANLDLFIEEIPYKQTRGYTKRVLSSFITYKFIYDENRPVFTPFMKLP